MLSAKRVHFVDHGIVGYRQHLVRSAIHHPRAAVRLPFLFLESDDESAVFRRHVVTQLVEVLGEFLISPKMDAQRSVQRRNNHALRTRLATKFLTSSLPRCDALVCHSIWKCRIARPAKDERPNAPIV